jgi:hypothetical protein
MTEIGNIPEHWGHRSEVLEASTWERSYSQHFATAIATDFSATALMERVWVDAQGSLIRRQELPAEVIRASELADDPELAVHAAAIQEHMTAMFGIKRARRLAEEDRLRAEAEAASAAQNAIDNGTVTP